ncbi:MAG: ribosome biogenesis GTPase Der [Pirellulales bacterium]
MAVPQVVIVGRPNVGKSSLFNWLAGKRLAIVDPTAGVTRDRMAYLIEEQDRYFEVVDTGGMGIKDIDNLTQHIEQQIATAIDLAELVLFVVDAREGVVPLDLEVAERLRHIEKPIVLVVNKADDASFDAQSAEFFKLGFGAPILVSTLQNRNREELFEAIITRLPPAAAEAPPTEPVMKLAIVGRRNTGKSTFVNTLAQTERVIVSEVAGTTRDSIDVRYELDGKPFIAIDTPGLRRSKSIRTDVDFYGLHRAQRSVRRADVVLLFFDAMQPISKVDKQLSDYILEQHKPCIFVVNKWDLVAAEVPTGDWAQYLRDTFRSMQYMPIAFITAQTGKNVKTLCNHAQMLFKQARHRVSTSELNNAVRDVLETNPPPMHHQGRPKIFYATQVDVEPPTIVLFCNNPLAFSATYRRYLLTALRDRLPFAEVPIRLYLRRREDSRGGRREPGDSEQEAPIVERGEN